MGKLLGILTEAREIIRDKECLDGMIDEMVETQNRLQEEIVNPVVSDGYVANRHFTMAQNQVNGRMCLRLRLLLAPWLVVCIAVQIYMLWIDNRASILEQYLLSGFIPILFAVCIYNLFNSYWEHSGKVVRFLLGLGVFGVLLLLFSSHSFGLTVVICTVIACALLGISRVLENHNFKVDPTVKEQAERLDADERNTHNGKVEEARQKNEKLNTPKIEELSITIKDLEDQREEVLAKLDSVVKLPDEYKDSEGISEAIRWAEKFYKQDRQVIFYNPILQMPDIPLPDDIAGLWFFISEQKKEDEKKFEAAVDELAKSIKELIDKSQGRY